MISSWQISQLHAQQTQAFGQQQQYTQQLSGMMPPMIGLGAQGGGGGMGGGFNYGGGWGNGYGPGNSFGNTMTSMIGGMGNAFGGVAKFGGSLAGGFMGGAMGSMIGALPGMAMQHVSGAMMEGAHEQAAIERTLSQFQFQNGSSRTGRGFNRNDASQIGNMVRQMERLPEMLTSFGELNRVMDKMGQMGLMQGVRDAGEFMRKFRDNISTLKDLAKMMGSTMEGALQAFGESRMAGFYSKGDITRNVLNRQITSAVTGMNQSQIAGLQIGGGALAHSLGGSRAGGAANFTRTAQQLGVANQMGILSNNDIMEMTGKEGAAGIEDLAGSMGQLAYRMGSSNVGQAMTLALGKMENGRYTGEMDQELVDKVRRGELTLGELKSLARKKAGTRGAKLSFSAHASRLRTEMAGAVGAEGIGMELQEILGERGWQNPDATNLVMQRFGASEEQANLLQKLMPNMQSIGTEIGVSRRNEGRMAANNAVMREHGWDAIKHKIGAKISHYTTDWAKDIGVGVRDYFQNWADEFLDDLSGQYRTYVTKRVTDAVISGGSSLKSLTAGARAFGSSLGTGSRLDVGAIGGIRGLGSRAAHWLSGDQTAGERTVDMARSFGLGRYLTNSSDAGFDAGDISSRRSGAERLSRKGFTVLDSSIFGGAVGTDAAGLDAIRSKIAANGNADESIKALQKVLNPEQIEELKKRYGKAMAGGRISQMDSQEDRMNAIFNTLKGGSGGVSDILDTGITGKLTRGEIGKGQVVSAIQALSNGKSRSSVDFGSLAGMVLDSNVGSARNVSNFIQGADKRLSKALGGDQYTASWSEVSKLLDEGGDMSVLFENMVGDKGEALRQILDKPSLDDGDRKKLTAMGINPGKIDTLMSTPEGRKTVDRLRAAAASGKISAEDLADYKNAKGLSGLITLSARFRERGQEASSRLSSASGAEARQRLSKSAGGKDILGKLGMNASLLSGTDFVKGQSADNTADVVASLRNLKGQDLDDALRLASDEVRQTFDQDKSTRGKLGKGLSTQGILDKLYGKDADVPKELRDQIESALGGKDKKLTGGKDLDAVMKILDDRISKNITAKGGTDQKSAYASEQEVANSLKTLSDNNVKIATILGNLAAGKSGKGLLEGTEGGTSGGKT